MMRGEVEYEGPRRPNGASTLAWLPETQTILRMRPDQMAVDSKHCGIQSRFQSNERQCRNKQTPKNAEKKQTSQEPIALRKYAASH